MRRLALLALVTVSGAALMAGCGGSSDVATTSGQSSGGGPASAGGRITNAARDVVESSPSVPVCNPGGLPNEDEETCQHFWNHMLQWQALDPQTEAQSGPKLVGAASGSMLYRGFEALEGASHWWGPNFCGGNPKQSDNCTSNTAGLPFGDHTLVETFDDGSAVKSRVTWQLKPGDVNFGNEYFTAYNDGGSGGTQWAFCGPRSGNPSGQWVSCSHSSDDGATINCNQPQGNDEDYCSYGWVVEDYPVLVGLSSTLPGSTFTMTAEPSLTGVKLSAVGSSKDAVSGKATLVGGQSAALWLAGYRQRAGTGDFGSISLQGKLKDTTKSSAGFDDATVTLTVRFLKPATGGTATTSGSREVISAPKCTVTANVGAGDQAKCEITQFVPGGPSSPGIVTAVIQRGSGA